MGSISCLQCSSKGKSPGMSTPHSNCKSIPALSNRIHHSIQGNSSKNQQSGSNTNRTPN